jgi:hypothetical protein
MPIVVGAPRSGTTLLRFMLDAHPDLAIPPETGFLALAERLGGARAPDTRQRFFDEITRFPPEAPAWSDFGVDPGQFRAALDEIEPFHIAGGFRAFYRLYAGKFGKARWGDKNYWKHCVTTARLLGAGCRHYLEVRFEDLVHDPALVLQRICAFIDLDFSPEMLNYYARVPARLAEHRERVRTDGTVLVSHTARVQQQARTMMPPQESRAGSWREAMSRDEQRRFEAVAGMLLRELGYEDLSSNNSGVHGLVTQTPDPSDVCIS